MDRTNPQWTAFAAAVIMGKHTGHVDWTRAPERIAEEAEKQADAMMLRVIKSEQKERAVAGQMRKLADEGSSERVCDICNELTTSPYRYGSWVHCPAADCTREVEMLARAEQVAFSDRFSRYR